MDALRIPARRPSRSMNGPPESPPLIRQSTRNGGPMCASTRPKRTSGGRPFRYAQRRRIAQLQHAISRHGGTIGEGDEGIRARLHQPQERQVEYPVRPEQLGLGACPVVQDDLDLGTGPGVFGVRDVGLREDQSFGRDDDPCRPDERNDSRQSLLDRGLDTRLESGKVRRSTAGIIGVRTCRTRRLLREEWACAPEAWRIDIATRATDRFFGRIVNDLSCLKSLSEPTNEEPIASGLAGTLGDPECDTRAAGLAR